MANAISAPSSDPAIQTLASNVLLGAAPAFTRFNDFVTDFSADAVAPGSTLKIGVNSVTQAATFDSSSNNYATGKESISFASVSMSHFVDSEKFTDAQLLEVPENVFNKAAAACARGITLAISDAIDDTFVAASMTGTALTVPHDGSLTKADIAGLSAQTDADAARCVLVFNRAYYAKCLALLDAAVYGGAEAIRAGRLDAGVYGFKSIQWAKLPDTIVGAVVPENGIVIAGRAVPCYSKAAYSDYRLETDPETGLTIGLRQFGIPETGENCIAVETAVGAALAQGAKIQKITVAAS